MHYNKNQKHSKKYKLTEKNRIKIPPKKYKMRKREGKQTKHCYKAQYK